MYGALMIDPPWRFEVWDSETGEERSAASHYDTMDFAALCELPMPRLMARDCVVFLWATWPLLAEALLLGDAWGLTYKTLAFDWLKRSPSGNAWHMGMGYWTRANSEPCLLFTRG